MLFIAIFFVSALSIGSTNLSSKIKLGSLAIITVLGLITQYCSVTLAMVIFSILGFMYLLCTNNALRKSILSKPLLKIISKSMPNISETERVALEAGTLGWDGELFSGNPNWKVLLDMPKPELSTEEQEFINVKVRKLCDMIDDWKINYIDKDLPKEMWDYLKKERFFGLLISKEHGGLGFSDLAHSEILSIIAGLSTTVASTVSVPNSLGPAELLHKYGTKEQQEYYLPRLAIGKDIPCFALTGPYAGSDATSLPDIGVVCKKTINGKEVIGLNLNFEKRYITLAPIATVVGLAFQMVDPENILGEKTDLGITCALLPAKTPGMVKGNRHMPLGAMFQNGVIHGKDVFISLDNIIGGEKMIGQGWRMLVECLSTGRAISLPSAAAGKAKFAAISSGAYARIREQFNTYVGRFEGVQEKLASLATNVYISDAARRVTAKMIDNGEKPSVPGAILKYHITERARQSAIDAMDIQAGKAVMMGPKNYTAESYINSPIGVTVEGANILTRNLIIFGQGSTRCHPFIMQELAILSNTDKKVQLEEFNQVLSLHIAFTIKNVCRSFVSYITGGRLIKTNINKKVNKQLQQISWASTAFVTLADFALLILGGKLKFKEMLSAKLGDLLSYLYLLSMCIKRYKDSNYSKDEELLFQSSFNELMYEFWDSTNKVISNFPNVIVRAILKIVIIPFGNPAKPVNDKEKSKLANILLTENKIRDNIFKEEVYQDLKSNNIYKLEETFKQVLKTHHIEIKVKKAVSEGKILGKTLIAKVNEAKDLGIINQQEHKELSTTLKMKLDIINVDDYENI